MMFLAGTALALAVAQEHPTLSQMWMATVKENEVGVVYESENFVSDHVPPTFKNPSAKWTNYTDGSCQRLIYQPYGNSDMATRYLLGCDAVDCCSEDGEGPIEYQIPNVHPAIFTKVRSIGRHEISLFDGTTVTADGWTWRFAVENFTVYTTGPSSGETYAKLVQWTPQVEGVPYPDQYTNYTIIPDSERDTWAMNFQVPKVCQGNVVSCNSLNKQGKLSDKSLRFVRAGRLGSQKFALGRK